MVEVNVVGHLYLKLIRGAFETAPRRLVINHENIAVGPEDVTKAQVDAGQAGRLVELNISGGEQLAREIVAGLSTGNWGQSPFFRDRWTCFDPLAGAQIGELRGQAPIILFGPIQILRG